MTREQIIDELKAHHDDLEGIYLEHSNWNAIRFHLGGVLDDLNYVIAELSEETSHEPE